MNGELLLAIEGMAILLMCAVAAVACRTRNLGWVDVGWSAGVGLAAIMAAVVSKGLPERRLLVASMAVLWAGRLAAYIAMDRVIGRAEDGRYKALREYWGPRTNRNFFIFCQAQTLLVVLFAIPLVAAMGRTEPQLTPWDAFGAVVWLIALGGEGLADLQLRRFRSDPGTAGTTCRRGLWKYSRHPNYFFEWIHWWAYVVMLIGHPMVWMALIGPSLMLLFLYKITGIPHAERQALRSRPDYADYQRTTSAFIPWFPRPPVRAVSR